MAARFRHLIIFTGILAAVTVLSGCLAVNVGDAGYADENLTIAVENTGAPSGAFVQVTVFRLSDFSQNEYLVVSREVSLIIGSNRIILPAKLTAGNYRAVHLCHSGWRQENSGNPGYRGVKRWKFSLKT